MLNLDRYPVQLATHTITVESGRMLATGSRTRARHRFTCSCGYTGLWWALLREALRDARRHVREVTA